MKRQGAGPRRRLLDAIAESVYRNGAAATSVATVLELAGVSRATFYRHFDNREDCLLAAYRDSVGRLRQRLAPALDAPPPGSASSTERLRALLEVSLDFAAEEPAAARLVLVEALAAGPRIREAHDRLVLEAEDAVERLLLGPDPGPSLQLPAAALLGAVWGIVSTRRSIARSDPDRRALVPLLLEWLGAYLLPVGARPLERSQWARLGRGLRHALETSPAGLQTSPFGPGAMPTAPPARGRLLTATAAIVARRGYAALTVSDIVAAAGVTRGVFYGEFRNKGDAFDAVQTQILRESIAAAVSEFVLPESWPERVWGGLRGMLGYAGAHPELTRLGVVETFAAGPAAIRRAHESRMSFALFLEEGFRLCRAWTSSRLVAEAIAGGVFGLMRRQLVCSYASEMLEVLPAASYVTLAPFLGASAALEFVQAEARRAPQGSRPASPPSPAPRAPGCSTMLVAPG